MQSAILYLAQVVIEVYKEDHMTRLRINRIVAIALSAVVLTAGAGCDDDNPVKSDPHAPSLRMKESPVYGGTEQPLSVTITWSSSDPDGDSLVHDVYFGTTLSPVQVASDLVDTSYTATDLNHATKYYWRIVARDSTGRQATISTRSFTTFSWVYPLAIGNTWEYSKVLVMTIITPDTMELPEHDTVYGTSHLEVASLDSLSDSLVAYRIHATLTQDSTRYDSDTWFNNVDDGLFVFAYQGTGSNAIPYKLRPGMSFTLLGRQFNSIDEILAIIERTLVPSLISSGRGDLEDPPVKSLQYPLTIGSQWTRRTAGNPWRIDKLVTDQEEIEVPAGQFGAFQIRWLYDLDADGNWDDEVTIVDHIADVGLVKRVISITGIEITSPWGDSAGYADFTEVIQLTGYSID